MPLRPTHSNINLMLAAGLLGLALFGLPWLWWELTAEKVLYLALVYLFTALVAGLILRRWSQGELDWFEPGICVGILYLVVFGYGGLRFMLDPGLLHPLLQQDREWIIRALFFVILGILAFWGGYYSRPGLYLHRLFVRPRRDVLRAHASIRPGIVLSLYLVGLTARLYMLRQGWWGYVMQHESYFSSLALAQVFIWVEFFCHYALVLALLDHFSHPRDLPRRLLAYGFFFSEIVWGFFSGMKVQVFLPVLFYMMIYSYKRRRLPLRYLGAAAVGLVLLYPPNSVYRQLVIAGVLEIHGPLDMIAAVPIVLREVLFQVGELNMYVEAGYESTVARTTLTQNYALLLKYLDHTGAYWYGRYLWMLPALILVPRFLWPSKPLGNKGYWFAVNVWGQDPRVHNSVAITFPGDLHLQFGLPSLLLGMFLVGVLCRWLYERYVRPRSDYGLFFYLFLFLPLFRPEGDVPFKLAGLARIFILLSVLSWAVFRFPRWVTHVQAAPRHVPQPVS